MPMKFPKNKEINICKGTLLQNWILKIACLEDKFLDDSKAVLKKIISVNISSNYNVDYDDINIEVDE